MLYMYSAKQIFPFGFLLHYSPFRRLPFPPVLSCTVIELSFWVILLPQTLLFSCDEFTCSKLYGLSPALITHQCLSALCPFCDAQQLRMLKGKICILKTRRRGIEHTASLYCRSLWICLGILGFCSCGGEWPRSDVWLWLLWSESLLIVISSYRVSDWNIKSP